VQRDVVAANAVTRSCPPTSNGPGLRAIRSRSQQERSPTSCIHVPRAKRSLESVIEMSAPPVVGGRYGNGKVVARVSQGDHWLAVLVKARRPGRRGLEWIGPVCRDGLSAFNVKQGRCPRRSPQQDRIGVGYRDTLAPELLGHRAVMKVLLAVSSARRPGAALQLEVPPTVIQPASGVIPTAAMGDVRRVDSPER